MKIGSKRRPSEWDDADPNHEWNKIPKPVLRTLPIIAGKSADKEDKKDKEEAEDKEDDSEADNKSDDMSKVV